MPGEFNPYCEWLGLAGDAAPDHYELLSLTRFEADERQITMAAEQAASKVRTFRPGPNTRAWSRLLDQIRAAKDCLCDPALKAEYDAGLLAGQPNKAAPVSHADSPRPPSALGKLANDLLPPGMAQPASKAALSVKASDAFPPSTASTINQTVQAKGSLQPSESASEVLFTEVTDDSLTPMMQPENFLPPGAEDDFLPQPTTANPYSSEAAPQAGAAWSVVPDQSPLMAIPVAAQQQDGILLARPIGSPQAPYDPITLTAQLASPLALSTAPSAASFAVSRQRQGTWMVLISVVAVVALFAGIGITVMVLSKRQPAASTELAEVRPPAVIPNAAPPTTSPPIRVNSDVSVPPEARPASEPTFVPPPATPAVAPLAAIPSPSPPVPTPEPTPLPAPVPSSIPPSPAPTTPPDLPNVTRAEVQALSKALEAAKVALGEQNFKAASAQLAKAELFVKLPKHKASVARLKQVAEYVQQFREAMAAAVQGMQAGETFKVGGSTQVAFVEALPDKVILRTAGTNKTYPFNDMPPGLAVAIADFKLPASEPKSRVAKGAYLLVHRRATSDTHEKAVALWQEAQAAGEDMAELLPFLNENYADLLKDIPAGDGKAN